MALFTLDQVKRNLTAHVPDTRPTGEAPRKAAVAMILQAHGENSLQALFMRRAENPRDPWSGQMSFPGGRVEPFDATLEAAARRETAEEVGVELPAESYLGRLDDIGGGRLAKRDLAVAPFVYHHPNPALTPNYEVESTIWIPLEFLANPANVSPYVFEPDPLKREFPAFVYDGYIVWGLTYRIVAGFVGLFGVQLPGEPIVTDVE